MGHRNKRRTRKPAEATATGKTTGLDPQPSSSPKSFEQRPSSPISEPTDKPKGSGRGDHADFGMKNVPETKDTMCQHCWGVRTRDRPLLLCAGCKIDRYCSKECQKAAWSHHRANCQINQKMRVERPEISRQHRLLKKFTNKYYTVFKVAGVHALDLHIDPSQYRHKLLVIDLCPIELEGQTYFFALDASVQPISVAGEESGKMLLADIDYTEVHRRKEGDQQGAFFTLLRVPSGLVSCVPVTYTKSLYQKTHKKIPWKKMLLDTINSDDIFAELFADED